MVSGGRLQVSNENLVISSFDSIVQNVVEVVSLSYGMKRREAVSEVYGLQSRSDLEGSQPY